MQQLINWNIAAQIIGIVGPYFAPIKPPIGNANINAPPIDIL